MEWQVIQHNLDVLQPVQGGFTNAKRGIITTPDGTNLFVKIGVDPITKSWVKKEISVYRSLAACGFKHIPVLSAVNNDNTGFALEYVDAANGWEWETAWTEDRLTATLEALDDLAALPTTPFSPELITADDEDVNENPWLMPDIPDTSRALLIQKLHEAGKSHIADQLDTLRNSFQFTSAHKALVHYDVRRDNCAWNPGLQAVKLVDWNWLHFGSREIDVCALLVNVYKSGLPLKGFQNRLDQGALMWLAGYWIASSVQPGTDTMSDPAALRSYQFASGVAAYELAT